MEIIYLLKSLSEKEETLIITIFSLILIANIIDWCFGWINAKLNEKINFISGKALLGIIKKMMYFIVMVFFTMIAYIIVPSKIAFSSIFTLTTGYLLSELNSILGHLGIIDDSKEDLLFIDFLNTIFNKEDKE